MIVPNTYIIRRNDTLPRIAAAYTGNPERWREIMRSNPQLDKRAYRTPYGLEYMPSVLFIGGTIFLPLTWPRVPRVRLGPIEMPAFGKLKYVSPSRLKYAGSLGDNGDDAPAAGTAYGPGNPSPLWKQKCDPPAAITNVKPYVYLADNNLFPGALAVKWGVGESKWHELKAANYDMGDGFSYNEYGICMFNKWSGAKLKIPASWPEYPPELASRIEMTGQPGVDPGTPGPGTVGPGGLPVGAEPVGAKEEGKIWGVPTWLVVAGGVVVGGAAVYLGARLMKKKSPSTRELEARVATSRLQPPPPALPA